MLEEQPGCTQDTANGTICSTALARERVRVAQEIMVGGREGKRERGEKEGGERGGEQERGGRERERMVERKREQGRERESEGAEHVRRCLEENT